MKNYRNKFIWHNIHHLSSIIVILMVFISGFFIFQTIYLKESSKTFSEITEFKPVDFDEVVYFEMDVIYQEFDLKTDIALSESFSEKNIFSFNGFQFLDFKVESLMENFSIRLVSLPLILSELEYKYPNIFNITESQINSTDDLIFYSFIGQNYEILNISQNNSFNLTGIISQNTNFSLSGYLSNRISNFSKNFIRDIFIPFSEEIDLILFVDDSSFLEITNDFIFKPHGIMIINYNYAEFNIKNKQIIFSFLRSPSSGFSSNSDKHFYFSYYTFGIHESYNDNFKSKDLQLNFIYILISLINCYLFYFTMKKKTLEFLNKNKELFSNINLLGQSILYYDAKIWIIFLGKILLYFSILTLLLSVGFSFYINYIIYNSFQFNFSIILQFFLPIFIILSILLTIGFILSYKSFDFKFQYQTTKGYSSYSTELTEAKSSKIKPFMITISLLILVITLIIYLLNAYNEYFFKFGTNNLALYSLIDLILPIISVLIISYIIFKNIFIIWIKDLYLSIIKILKKFLSNSKNKYTNVFFLKFWTKRNIKNNFNSAVIYYLIFSLTFLGFLKMQEEYYLVQHNYFVNEDIRITLDIRNNNQTELINNYFSNFNIEKYEYIFEYSIYESNLNGTCDIFYIPKISGNFTFSNSIINNYSSEGAIIKKGLTTFDQIYSIFLVNNNSLSRFPIQDKLDIFPGVFTKLKEHRNNSIVIWGNSSFFNDIKIKSIHLFLKFSDSNPFTKPDDLLLFLQQNSIVLRDYQEKNIQSNVLPSESFLIFAYPLLFLSIVLYVQKCLNDDIFNRKEFVSDTSKTLHLMGMEKKQINGLKQKIEGFFSTFILINLFLYSLIFDIILFNLISIKFLNYQDFSICIPKIPVFYYISFFSLIILNITMKRKVFS